jgi:macrolide transport system ATP-binding/permease protein
MGILSWFKRRRLDEDDFNAEIRSHLALAEQERIADGADRTSAHYAALKEFGNVTLTTEAARRVWTPWWLEAVRDSASDIRYAIRALVKHPAFSLTVIAVLTLGIALNAMVFTMLKGLALSPLGGVDGSAQLRVLYRETDTGRTVRVSYPDYQHLRDHIDAFTALMATGYYQFNLGRGRGAHQISGELVTGNYFQVLGTGAQLGRTLLPSDEVAPGRHPLVVISDGLWRRDFGTDPEIIGKTLELNTYPLTVVGVTEPTFHGTILSYDVEAFVPLMMAAQLGIGTGTPGNTTSDPIADSRYGMLFPIGYVRSGVTSGSVTAQVDALWKTISADRPLTDPAHRMRVVPFWRAPNGGQRYVLPTIVLLTAMGLLVLMIACANIAGLVLVRGVSRRGEIAVRLAIGASRLRIIRLLIAENLVLAIPGAVLGVLLAQQGMPFLVEYAEWLASPQRLFLNLDVDRVTVAFGALAACGSALVFGFVPALQASRVELVSVINEDASPRGASRGRLRASLVVAQVAVSLFLLVAAGLVSRSFDAARRTNPGFDKEHVATVAVDLMQNGYGETRGRVFYRKLLDAARADTNVESATLSAFTPLGFLDTKPTRVTIEGYAPRRGEDLLLMSNTIASDYFRTLRIDFVAGRPFDDHDDEGGAPVIVVNANLAQRFWGSAANALGKRMRAADGAWRIVIGVAADVKYSKISDPPRPYFYLPFLQAYRSGMILQTRGSVPVNALVDQARAHVVALDSNLPILAARPLTELTQGAFLFYRLATFMLALFGATGMALAAMGIYGLVSYTVKQSTHEIGIRMALGASARSVVRYFLARGLRLGIMGVLVGTLAALASRQLLRSVLFGVSTTDPAVFAGAFALVIGGVILATLIPAWRAARIDPLRALRHH